jgi:hypothetical protein
MQVRKDAASTQFSWVAPCWEGSHNLRSSKLHEWQTEETKCSHPPLVGNTAKVTAHNLNQVSLMNVYVVREPSRAFREPQHNAFVTENSSKPFPKS